MKLVDYTSKWWGEVFNKRRFSIQNAKNNIEEWYIYISLANIYMACLSFALFVFIAVLLLVAYTPMLKLLPGYRTNATRMHEDVIQNIIRLDSLERVIGDMRTYNDNVALILEGKTTAIRTILNSDNSRIDKSLVLPSPEDAILRAQMEGEGEYRLNNKSTKSTSDIRKSMELAMPAEGIVTENFNIKEERMGMSVATAPSTRISAVDDGTVTISVWTPENGYIIQLQHSDNRISIYKNLSQALVTEGMYIKKSELIGYGPESSEDKKEIKPFVFELWYSGKPIDPEQYIIF